MTRKQDVLWRPCPRFLQAAQFRRKLKIWVISSTGSPP
jgi:hypothetical protein